MDDKDFIIVAQQEQVQQLVRQVIDMQKLVEKLCDEIARLKKNSSNSSKLPYLPRNTVRCLPYLHSERLPLFQS